MWELVICCALLADVNETIAEAPRVATLQEVDDLARTYRIQVYDAFRTQRPTYDQWAEAGFKVLEFSELVRTQSPHRSEFAEWFRQATEASTTNAHVPTLPQLDPALIVQKKQSSTLPVGAFVEPVTDRVEADVEVEPEANDVQPAADGAHAESSIPWGSIGEFLKGKTDSGESSEKDAEQQETP